VTTVTVGVGGRTAGDRVAPSRHTGRMGWRIGFGVGPLRYSTPLTGRRRRQPYQAPAPQPQQDLPSMRSQWITGVVAALVIAAMCGGLIALFYATG
jgi:hypothetical protein